MRSIICFFSRVVIRSRWPYTISLDHQLIKDGEVHNSNPKTDGVQDSGSKDEKNDNSKSKEGTELTETAREENGSYPQPGVKVTPRPKKYQEIISDLKNGGRITKIRPSVQEFLKRI